MTTSDWTNGIVAIYDSTGASTDPVGTGFVVSADGLILTCAHVLVQAGWSYQAWDEPVRVRFRANRHFAEALVQEHCFSPQTEDDYALLALEGALPDGVEILALWSAAAAAGHATAMFGYPAGFDEGLRGEGSALGSVTQDGRPILQLRSTETTRGYSGGPVWHPVWGRVIGVVLRGVEADALGRLAFTSFAIPAETLAEHCPARLSLTAPESNVARATQDISGAANDLVNGYTARSFVGRDADLERLDAWLGSNDSGRMIVTALAGYGKTALLARWLRRRQSQGDFVAFHFFSNRDEFLRPLANAYGNLLGQLAVYYGLPDETLPDVGARPARLRAMIDGHDPALGQRLIILLDALDECERPFQLSLPIELPDGVYLVASARASRLRDEGDAPPYLDGWTADAASIHLERLPQVALAGWLAASADGALVEESRDPAFVAKLAQVSDGYPLYLRYLLEDLVEAKRSGRSADDVLDGPAQRLGGYVRARLRNLSRSLGREDEIQDLFVLLAVARYALLEDEVLTLTELDPFELLDLPAGLTRWLNIGQAADGQKIYSFAHAKLAEEFEIALRGAATSKRDALLAWCASFMTHHSPFALRHYASLLLQAQRYDALYELVYDEEYGGQQIEYLPAEGDLNLRTVRLALEAAADQADAARMAEFLLEHGCQVLALRRASPLGAWRSMGGAAGLARAWSLADANDPQWRLIWLLLLVWELSDDGHTAEAEATLARLTPDRLPTLSRGRPFIVFHLLRRLLAEWPLQLLPVTGIVLDDRGQGRLCQKLGRDGQWETALDLAQQIADTALKADALRRLVYLQCDAGLVDQAMAAVATIDKPFAAALARRRIAEHQADAGQPDEALQTANEIAFDGLRAGTLGWIAVAFGRSGAPDRQETVFGDALAICSAIEDAYDACLAQKDVASALHEAGRNDQAAESFAVALSQIDRLVEPEQRDNARRQVALAQAWTGRTAEALATVAAIDDDDGRLEALQVMANNRSWDGEFEAARQIAAAVDDEWDRGWLDSQIAGEQARAGDFAAAQAIIDDIVPPTDRAWALAELALAQYEADQAAAAATSLSAAKNLADQLHDPSQQAREWRHIALIQGASGDKDGANASFAQALEIVSNELHWDDGKYLLIDVARAQARAGDQRAARDTMASVLTGGQSAQEPANGDQVLQDIAVIQAGAGHFAAARETADWIIPAYERVTTLLRVADRQAEQPSAGLTGISETLARAIEAAGRIPASDFPDDVLIEIGTAQARAGLIVEARETAGLLGETGRAGRILNAIAQYLVHSGDIGQALQVAAEIERPEPAAVTYAAIAAGQLQAGESADGAASFQRALDMAGTISGDLPRAGAYRKVGATLASMGRAEEARIAFDLAGQISSDQPAGANYFSTTSLALALVDAGRIEEALEHLDTLASAGIEAPLLLAVARHQARNGDYDAASEAAGRISKTVYRVDALVTVADLASVAGAPGRASRLLQEALEVSRAIDDYGQYCERLALIAVAQVRAGQPSRAVRTAGSIQASQGNHLPPIATALAAAGDARRLAQMLQLCAQDPQAALSAVPAIAQLYPDQAPAIAQRVAGHTWA